jgi:hypothetical protein
MVEFERRNSTNAERRKIVAQAQPMGFLNTSKKPYPFKKPKSLDFLLFSCSRPTPKKCKSRAKLD